MTKNKDDIVITGAGVCCNMGDRSPAIVLALREGQAPVFETWRIAVEHNTRCQVVALYHGDLSNRALNIQKQQGRFMGRAARMALHATRTALSESKLEATDIAVVVGSGTGDVATHIEVYEQLAKTDGARKVSPTVIPRLMSSTVSANLVNVLHTTGPSFSVAAACAGGAYNILLASQLIKNGQVKAAIAGGVEVADIHFHVGFDAMRAYNRVDNEHPERASRPYAADRAGFIFGEGAGVIVLEKRSHAEAREATILGVLAGFGTSSDGQGQMVIPSSEGALAAMRNALQYAGCRPEDIDYINTHGTSTPLGDVGEILAIRELLDGRHVSYSSTKGYTGHTISGAGAIELIFTLWMMRGGWIAPSVNTEPLDPELQDYPPVVEPKEKSFDVALSNSFGFGGTNATLVLRRE